MNALAPSIDLTVRVRSAVESDMRYIVSTWRSGWWGASKNRRLNAADFRNRFERAVVGGILAESDTRVLVACDAEDPDTITGWCCFTPGIPTLHWCYVREAHPVTGESLRRRGLFGDLMTAMGVREGEGIAYTMRPQEFQRHSARGSRWRPIANHMESDLLAAAKARGVAVSFVPIDRFLSPK